jgi:AraC-like DNA-binding protein
MRMHPGASTDDTSFFIPPEKLYSLVDDMNRPLDPKLEKMLQDPYSSILAIGGKATPAMQLVFEQIRNCELRGGLRRLYLEGKIRKFLALRLQQACIDGGMAYADFTLTSRERDRIHDARDIIVHSLHDPPTIPVLARRIGLNTSKLKAGFKEEFRITVFGYIHYLRMFRAMALLRDTDLNVSQVALEVGYSNTSAFSRAFKREMGFNPNLLQ